MVQGLKRIDYLRSQEPLEFEATYYPGGFHVEIATNSPNILRAAEEAWGHYRPEFACEPIHFRVLVGAEGELSGIPSYRMQGHLYSIVSDPYNFAQVDLARQFGFFHVSEATAADHSWLRWFFIEAAAYVVLTQRHIVPIHAACIARERSGTLLSGPSGAGKSTLSYACARAGWTFVSDDATWLLPNRPERIAIGRPRQARFRLDAPGLFPELEGYIARARPTGKVSIEVPLAELPGIRTADRVPIEGIVFLDRGPGAAGAEPLSGAEAVERVLADLPSYNDAVDAMHERTVRKLAGARAWRMRYETLADAIGILGTLGL
jgi:hypothetical protein